MLHINSFKRLSQVFRKQTINVLQCAYFSTHINYDASVAKKYVNVLNTHDPSSPMHWYMKPAEDNAISYVLNMKNKENKSVLDVACGIGHYCERVKQLGFGTVVGIDSAPAQLEEANALYKDKNIVFKVVDALKLKNKKYADEFHGKFDVVNASWLFDYAQNKDELYAEIEGIYKCLKNGGLYTGLFINENVKSSYQSEWDEFQMYWAKNKEPGAEIKEGECIDFYIHGIELHVYKWHYKTAQEMLQKIGFVDIQFVEPTEWDLLNKDVYEWHTDEEQQKFLKYVYEMGNFTECAMNATKKI